MNQSDLNNKIKKMELENKNFIEANEDELEFEIYLYIAKALKIEEKEQNRFAGEMINRDFGVQFNTKKNLNCEEYKFEDLFNEDGEDEEAFKEKFKNEEVIFYSLHDAEDNYIRDEVFGNFTLIEVIEYYKSFLFYGTGGNQVKYNELKTIEKVEGCSALHEKLSNESYNLSYVEDGENKDKYYFNEEPEIFYDDIYEAFEIISISTDEGDI